MGGRLSYTFGYNKNTNIMHGSQFGRPLLAIEDMDSYTAIESDIGRKFGRIVRAFEITNREYTHRHNELSKENNMKSPPRSDRHIMQGYLVVRNVGSSKQYETWMPEQVFEELYVYHEGK